MMKLAALLAKIMKLAEPHHKNKFEFLFVKNVRVHNIEILTKM